MGEKKSQTLQKVQDSKICDTLGCHRFYYLAPLPVIDPIYLSVYLHNYQIFMYL